MRERENQSLITEKTSKALLIAISLSFWVMTLKVIQPTAFHRLHRVSIFLLKLNEIEQKEREGKLRVLRGLVCQRRLGQLGRKVTYPMVTLKLKG